MFCESKQWAAAAACFEAIVQQDPAHAIAWNNLGNVRDELGDVAGAYAAFHQALTLVPDYVNAKKNWAIVAYKEGHAQYTKGQLQQALAAFQTAAVQMADAQGQRCADYDHSYLQLLLETCEHAHVTKLLLAMQRQSLAQVDGESNPAYCLHPYPLLAAVDQPLWHLSAAQHHVMRLCRDAGVRVVRPVPPPRASRHVRIRIAYLSSDWHEHPVPQQLIPSIEAHDREQFEVIGIATDGAGDVSLWRKRIERAFDQFHVLGHLSDEAIADQLRAMAIDVAIDLSLYMQSGRPLILASRPCAVQVAFLGYAGTSGAPWIDYLIADEVVIPPSHASFYSEKVVRLPGSFMPDNDQRPLVRAVNQMAASRAEQGLPEQAFVFCAFSNPYKITPDLLACWFRLLHRVQGSVLWLQANNDVTKRHIESAASAAGLTADRLIFASRMDDFAQHIQRYPLADLFLDTYPYNAHVTAADSLWAGLPVLTLQGDSFASRVASSVLRALGLQELITTDLVTYEAKAFDIANDAMQLKELRSKLEKSKAEKKYFHQTQYVRQLEQALTEIAEVAPIQVIAYSLWGDNPVYLEGAIKNAQLAAKFYPHWICRFYCANDLPSSYLMRLQAHANVQVVLMPPEPDRGGAFWRFLAASDPSVSRVIFRDTDSRPSMREVAAVNEWLASDQAVHLMRDHPFHWPDIMAGMWGCKGGALMEVKEQLASRVSSNDYGADQTFLSQVIYPRVKHQCFIHDAVGLSEAHLDVHPFPLAREGLTFVGQCYDEHDQPNTYYEQELAAWLQSH